MPYTISGNPLRLFQHALGHALSLATEIMLTYPKVKIKVRKIENALINFKQINHRELSWFTVKKLFFKPQAGVPLSKAQNFPCVQGPLLLRLAYVCSLLVCKGCVRGRGQIHYQ